MTVKIVQIIAAPWTSESSGITSYTLFGLGKDNKVYKCDSRDGRWVPLDMTVVR